MFDEKVKTFITLVNTGSYTKAAKKLSLTQPAVSHQIKQMEQEFDIRIFYRDKNKLRLTEEGEVLLKYARRAYAIYQNAKQAIEDCKTNIKHLIIGITPTAGENRVPQMIAVYCNKHPELHVNIFTDTIKNIYDKLKSYEIDLAIVEGKVPEGYFTSVLLDTDYLCLAVSPRHHLAKHGSISLAQLKRENFILRSKSANTRALFEHVLVGQGESIKNFHIMMEIDNIATIKELVAQNLGITIIAYSACREEELSGRLKIVPIENVSMVREVNMVHPIDFTHTDVLEEMREIYESLR